MASSPLFRGDIDVLGVRKKLVGGLGRFEILGRTRKEEDLLTLRKILLHADIVKNSQPVNLEALLFRRMAAGRITNGIFELS